MNRYEVNKKTIIYLPIEIKVRELTSKILLACFAAESGFKIITGNRNKVESYLMYMPHGIYFAKAASYGDLNLLQKISNVGHNIVALDEEGLGIYRSRNKIYLNRIFSIETCNLLKFFFFWGNIDSEIIISEMSNTRQIFVVTGSPRIDILRPEFIPFFTHSVQKITNSFNPFILINTNFSGCNNFHGSQYHDPYLELRTEKYGMEYKNTETEIINFEKDTFNHFIKMIREVSRTFPHYTIVIRPHPGENHGFWRDAMKDYKNVRVIHEGSAIPWIWAADALIHNSCTTGIESYVMNTTPTFAYCPVRNDDFDMYLPNDLSHKASTLDELIAMLRSAIDDENGKKGRENIYLKEDPVKKAIANEHIASLEGSFACEKIVKELKKIHVNENKLNIPLRRKLKLYAENYYYRLKDIFKDLLGLNAYSHQKFPGLELQEVVDCITKFQETSGRFKSIRVKQIDKDLFEIWSSNELENEK